MSSPGLGHPQWWYTAVLPALSAAVPVQGMELAQSVAFDNTLYTVNVGETTKVYATVQPATATRLNSDWVLRAIRTLA